MKIAFFTNSILEGGGGLTKYFIDTSANLIKFFPQLDISIITLNEDFASKLNILLSIYYFKNLIKGKVIKEKTKDIINKLGKVKYIKCSSLNSLKEDLKKYDVIYSKNEILEAFTLKYLIGYKNLPPIIFGCHTPIYYPIAKSFHAKLHNFLYNGFVYKFLAGNVSKFHVTNNFDLKALKKLFPEKEVIRIYNPFDSNQFNFNLRKYTYNFNWDKSKFNILWVARLTEQKGVSSLISIINILNKTSKKNKLVFNILGDGPMIKEIINLKKKWSNINFFGYVNYKYLPSIYYQNDLFISTSKWECFPYNILEAQTQGIPVIAFNIPGPQDIIENKITGFLVNNENDFVQKIISLLGGDEKISKERIIKNTINKFNPEKINMELKKMFIHVDNIK